MLRLQCEVEASVGLTALPYLVPIGSDVASHAFEGSSENEDQVIRRLISECPDRIRKRMSPRRQIRDAVSRRVSGGFVDPTDCLFFPILCCASVPWGEDVVVLD